MFIQQNAFVDVKTPRDLLRSQAYYFEERKGKDADQLQSASSFATEKGKKISK